MCLINTWRHQEYSAKHGILIECLGIFEDIGTVHQSDRWPVWFLTWKRWNWKTEPPVLLGWSGFPIHNWIFSTGKPNHKFLVSLHVFAQSSVAAIFLSCTTGWSAQDDQHSMISTVWSALDYQHRTISTDDQHKVWIPWEPWGEAPKLDHRPLLNLAPLPQSNTNLNQSGFFLKLENFQWEVFCSWKSKYIAVGKISCRWIFLAGIILPLKRSKCLGIWNNRVKSNPTVILKLLHIRSSLALKW